MAIERLRRVLPAALVLAAAGAATAWWLLGSAEAPPTSDRAEPRIPVRTVRVDRSDVPELIRAVGYVRSKLHVVIRPQIDGRLVELAVQEGQMVHQGDLLARIDDREIRAALEEARAQSAMTRAQLQAARQDLQRYRALEGQNVVSRQMLDQQSSRVEELAAAVRAQEAAVAVRTIQLSHTRLYAPTDGRVGLREVDEGNFVTANNAAGLFSISRMDPISVEIALPQSLLPSLQVLLDSADPAPVCAYAGEGGPLLSEGRLVAIDNRVSAENGTVRVKADFDNADGRLWPGQSVVVTVQLAVRRDALAVPEKAIQQGLDGPFVYRVHEGRVEVVPVTLVYRGDGRAVVTGVEAGDEVVYDGQSRLRAGAAVQSSRAAPQAATVGTA